MDDKYDKNSEFTYDGELIPVGTSVRRKAMGEFGEIGLVQANFPSYLISKIEGVIPVLFKTEKEVCGIHFSNLIVVK